MALGVSPISLPQSSSGRLLVISVDRSSYRRLEQETVELPKPQCGETQVTIDSLELAMWIGGVSLKSAKTRRKRMSAA